MSGALRNRLLELKLKKPDAQELQYGGVQGGGGVDGLQSGASSFPVSECCTRMITELCPDCRELKGRGGSCGQILTRALTLI